jgi:hypothetical protein
MQRPRGIHGGRQGGVRRQGECVDLRQPGQQQALQLAVARTSGRGIHPRKAAS